MWHKGDIDGYNTSLHDKLEAIDITSDNLIHPTEIDAMCLTVQSILYQAADENIPSKRTKLKGPKKPLHPDTVATLKESRKAHQKWKEAGKPGPGSLLHGQKTNTKRAVCKSFSQTESNKKTLPRPHGKRQ